MVFTKKELYQKEQYEILIKLLNIIGITKNNTTVQKSYIETIDILDNINSLKNDILKFFSTRKWHATKTGVNIEINFIRNIIREFNIEMLSLEKRKKDEESNKTKSYRYFKFIIPENILNDL